MIKATKVDNLEAALAISKEIKGHGIYDGYENCKKDAPIVDTYYVDQETGNVFYIFIDDRFNLKLLNKLTLHSSLSSQGFNQAMIFEGDNNVVAIDIATRGWDKGNKNRKAIAARGWIVTGEAA